MTLSWTAELDKLLLKALEKYEINSANLKEIKKVLGVSSVTLKQVR